MGVPSKKPDDPKPGLEAKTETQVTPDGNNYTLTTKRNNVPTGKAVIIAAYKADGTLLNIKKQELLRSEDITTEFIGIENISYFLRFGHGIPSGNETCYKKKERIFPPQIAAHIAVISLCLQTPKNLTIMKA